MPKAMQFGKYKGVGIVDVPTAYLEWLVESMESGVSDIRAELERRRQVEEANLSWAEKVIQTGFRELSKRHHPDIVGGDGADMRELNNAVEALREMLRIDEAVRRSVRET